MRVALCGFPGLVALPMVAMILVLRAATGSESISRRQRCSRKVSAIAAGSCCCWKKAVPSSWVSWATLTRLRYPAGPAVDGDSGSCTDTLPVLHVLPASAPCVHSDLVCEAFLQSEDHTHDFVSRVLWSSCQACSIPTYK